MLPQEVRNIFRWENRIGRSAADFIAAIHSQPEQRFVGENYTKPIIDDGHSLVELFKNTLHLAKPIGSLDVGVSHDCVPSSATLDSRCSSTSNQAYSACSFFCDAHV